MPFVIQACAGAEILGQVTTPEKWAAHAFIVRTYADLIPGRAYDK
jgi:hypothetical protein